MATNGNKVLFQLGYVAQDNELNSASTRDLANQLQPVFAPAYIPSKQMLIKGHGWPYNLSIR
jgi:hypothetical protein